jgi:hypothetical protein
MKLRCYASALVLTVSAAACSYDERAHAKVQRSSSPIFGGTPSSRFPSVVWAGGECSAVVVHPRLVVLAAHCGLGARIIELGDGSFVEAYECHAIASPAFAGRDLAYCVLDEMNALDRDGIIPPLTSCELDALVPGIDVVMVGFGDSEADGGAGTRREAVATLVELGDELEVQRPSVGTCSGDSGGGAFVRVDGDGGAWRFAGVLSSGVTEDCSDGPSYYTPIWPFLSELELATGFLITPSIDTSSSTCGEGAKPAATPTTGCSTARPGSAANGSGWALFTGLLAVLSRFSRTFLERKAPGLSKCATSTTSSDRSRKQSGRRYSSGSTTTPARQFVRLRPAHGPMRSMNEPSCGSGRRSGRRARRRRSKARR